MYRGHIDEMRVVSKTLLGTAICMCKYFIVGAVELT